MTAHEHTDSVVGQPLFVDCYDYPGELMWQWWAPELWRRFTITLRRRLATHLGLSEQAARQITDPAHHSGVRDRGQRHPLPARQPGGEALLTHEQVATLAET